MGQSPEFNSRSGNSNLRDSSTTPGRRGGSHGEVRISPAVRRHFLFVSAPFGPFAQEVAEQLEAQGARCSRVILNAGDWLDWRRGGRFTYAGRREGWPVWLRRLIGREAVTDMVTYGDSSAYAVAAIGQARDLGLPVHVLEQGYFRPDWITLERDGVNANSRLPRDPTWHLAQAHRAPEPADEVVGRAMPSAVMWIIRYHVAVYLGAPMFPSFRAGYSRSAILQSLGHIVRFFFRDALVHGHAERRRRLMEAQGPLFLALLQRPGDSQLWRHSEFENTADFLEKVVSSFAAHAPADATLMVRPHPLDPGLEPHERTLRWIAEREGVADRVQFVDDGKLHEILPRIDGAVCVNSTAGLAAIEFGRPTIVLGRAIYDMPGLTHQGGLDLFWREPEAPSAKLYDAFRRVVLATTQVNGAFATPRGRALAAPRVAERLMSATETHSLGIRVLFGDVGASGDPLEAVA
jgi:capsular polysaccharide export protein